MNVAEKVISWFPPGPTRYRVSVASVDGSGWLEGWATREPDGAGGQVLITIDFDGSPSRVVRSFPGEAGTQFGALAQEAAHSIGLAKTRDKTQP